MKTPTRSRFRPVAPEGSFALALVALLASVGFEAAAQTYTITDLGTLGSPLSEAFGLNNFGQVVGVSPNAKTYHVTVCDPFCDPQGHQNCCHNESLHNQGRAFLWTPSVANGTRGSMLDLGALGGGNAYNSAATALNSFGQVVGLADPTGSGSVSGVGFLWTPDGANLDRGSMVAIGGGTPSAINNAGQILLGRTVWQNGVLATLSPLPGDYDLTAYNLNDIGQVVGRSVNNSGQFSRIRAFLWRGGAIRDLGALPGLTNSAAWAINTNGQVVGRCWNWNQNSRAFLFRTDSSGAVISRFDLGVLPGYRNSFATSLNNRGEVVGVSCDQVLRLPFLGALFTPVCPAPFIWDNANGLRNLNGLIPAGSGWELADVRAINDFGQIVGTAWDSAHQYFHAVLLTPQPAPRLTAPVLQPTGLFRVTLLGEVGRSYTIQASTNLVNWTALTNFVSATGTSQFTDPAVPNFSRRFYRAVTP